MIHWKKIDEFIEPNWEKMAALASPALFWRGKKEVAVFGYIRDGELFDHKWMYVCELEQGDSFLRGERPREQRGAASPRRLGVTAVEPLSFGRVASASVARLWHLRGGLPRPKRWRL